MIEAILELENKIFENQVINKEMEVAEVAAKHSVKANDLLPYFDLFVNYKVAAKNKKITVQKHIVWTSEERLIVDYFVKNFTCSKVKKFSYLARILVHTERTKESISFHYYNNVAPKNKQEQLKLEMKNFNIIKKSSEQVKGDLVELDNEVENVNNQLPVQNDFLSNFTTFIKNAQALNNFNLEDFFQGLTILSSLAANKVNNEEEMKDLKNDLKEQKELNEKLKNEISNMKKQISNIYEEVSEFDSLNGIEKVVKIESFSESLVEMVKKW